ncbi:MAG TPA: acyl-CoA dehydratase activase-related protein, partial [bacterium]|nr:acyl-CoA dehydratase activase-related protein [bacterium]
KVAQAHIHNLLFHHHHPEPAADDGEEVVAGESEQHPTQKRHGPLNYVFFPIITHVQNVLADTMDSACCPIVAGAPDVMKAAFTKEIDFFATRGIEYLDTPISFNEPVLMAKRMFETWKDRLGITEDESDHAHKQGLMALAALDRDLQEKARAILDTVEADGRIAILMLGRPYHSDPGLNHGIPDEFQALGYPILSVRSLPRDREYLARYFKDEVARGQDPLDINDVWPENYSANSAQKVWAAKFGTRHPNVALLDLSSFKCGHDAPTYGIIDNIVSGAGAPYAALHDIDANKPGGSLKIRVKTYSHTLKLRQEALEDVGTRRAELELSVDRKRLELLQRKQQQLAARKTEDPALTAQIASLSEKLASYQPKTKPAPEAAPGLIQLGRKRTDAAAQAGKSLVTVENAFVAVAPPAVAVAAAPAEETTPEPERPVAQTAINDEDARAASSGNDPEGGLAVASPTNPNSKLDL